MDRTLGRVKAEGHISFKGIRINKILELVNAWVGWRVEVHGKGKWWWKKKEIQARAWHSILCHGCSETQGTNGPVKAG